jgi:flavin-dependent dehydrogenase
VAGAAAAIVAAQRGLAVTVVERAASARQPGETLHPGAEALFRQLGVWEAVVAADFVRHPGHHLTWGGPQTFVPFGSDDSGPWMGFQARRPELDDILLKHACALGASLVRLCTLTAPMSLGRRIAGVSTSEGPLHADFVIDATGRAAWMARTLRLPWITVGPKRIVWYGYAEGDAAALRHSPSLSADESGWTWTARIGADLHQWTHWSSLGWRPGGSYLPPALHGLRPLGRPRGADMSWRVLRSPAGRGYCIVGDAAAVLDPTAGNGVLRALMSGIMAAHVARAILDDVSDRATHRAAYNTWLHAWFASDVATLQEFQECAPFMRRC